MPSPARRSCSWISWADRKSSSRSSIPDTAARCRVARIARGRAVTDRLLRVLDRVHHDVRQVVVHQRVHHLAAVPVAVHHARPP